MDVNKFRYIRGFGCVRAPTLLQFHDHEIHLHFNLCHLRMTPLRTIPQQVNDVPYTTPAKKGLKIGPRVCCRVLIFSGPLLRISLNDGIQIAEEPFCKYESVPSIEYLMSLNFMRLY